MLHENKNITEMTMRSEQSNRIQIPLDRKCDSNVAM